MHILELQLHKELQINQQTSIKNWSIPGWPKAGRGWITAGAPLARGGTAAVGTEDTKGGDIPTTGIDAIGTGATAVRGGILGRPPIPVRKYLASFTLWFILFTKQRIIQKCLTLGCRPKWKKGKTIMSSLTVIKGMDLI